MLDPAVLRQGLARLLTIFDEEAPRRLRDEMRLREELGLDSVDIVSLVMHVEAQYRITLTRQDLQRTRTVGDLVRLIQCRVGHCWVPTAA
jgi:acyl carrier protein